MKSRFYWTNEKEEELIRLWQTESLYKLAAYFHTTEKALQEKAASLGLGEYKSNRWTKEEEQLLIEYSKKYVTKTIAKKLNRSIIAVQKKAIKLGLELNSTKDPWKKWMVDYLKDNINQRPIGEIQNMIGLSYHQVLKKCKELGIEYQKESWTEEEIAILREYASKCHYTELVKVLPRRSVGAITAKAYELGIETISDYVKLDDATALYIKQNWGKIPAAEMARNLKISLGVVYRYKKVLNLPNVNQHIKWTQKKLEHLREDALVMSREELAKKYKTSAKQIYSIARKYNIPLLDAKKVWTDELDAKLLELLEQELTIQQVAEQMQIKAGAIRERLSVLKDTDISKLRERKKWTPKEVETLKNMADTSTVEEIAEVLGLTEEQVYHKALRLGIKVNTGKCARWTSDESARLIELSKTHSLPEIAKLMNRSEDVVSKHAKTLGLALTATRKAWTTKEEATLAKYAEEYTIKEIAALLGRSVASVSGKLKELGISAQKSSYNWTVAEEETLAELAKTKTASEIAAALDKSKTAVVNKLYKQGLRSVKKKNKPWSKEEELELQELLTTYSTFEIASLLDRTEEAIRIRAKKLGYQLDQKNRRWTTSEETELSDLWGTASIESIARKLNRTPSAIAVRASFLKLGSQIDNNYEGLRIQEIADIFGIQRETILTSWVNLGLNLTFRKRSNNSIYSFVTIENLYNFLEKNQSIWDSKTLERNILGIEPEWLTEKRKSDSTEDSTGFHLDNLTKQQLIQAKKYFLELQEESQKTTENPKQKVKKKV